MSFLNTAICTTISYTLWVEWYYLKNDYLTCPTKTVLEVLNDIEVRQSESPGGVKIAGFFRSIICNDKALYLKFLTYILVPVITTLFGVLWGTFSTRREPSMADTSAILTPPGLSDCRTSISLRTSRTVFVGPKTILLIWGPSNLNFKRIKVLEFDVGIGFRPSMADTSGREPKIKKQYRNYIS
jgi:hypothetical protein